jgi:hypothetical protein
VQRFVRFGVTPRRRKNRRSGDRDQKCFLCGFVIKALSREPHSVITRNCVRMSENFTIGDHSIAEIPMIGERGAPSLTQCWRTQFLPQSLLESVLERQSICASILKIAI